MFLSALEKIFPLHPRELAAPIGVVRLRRRLLESTTVRITVYQYDEQDLGYDPGDEFFQGPNSSPTSLSLTRSQKANGSFLDEKPHLAASLGDEGRTRRAETGFTQRTHIHPTEF